MISNKIEQAHINPEKDYHLKMDIWRVVRLIESEREHSKFVEKELDQLESDHPVYRFIEAIDIWETSGHKDFDNGIKTALEYLDELYELALENDWNSVASFCLSKLVEYREQLGGFDPTSQFDEVLEFLHSNYYGEPEANLGQLRTHIDRMIQHLDEMDDEAVSSLLDLLRDRREHLREAKNFMTERNYLDYLIAVKNHRGEDISAEQSRIIESSEEEFELKESAKSFVKADILERGVAKCRPYLSDDKDNEWRLKIRELNKQAKDDMQRFKHEVDVGDDVSTIIDSFKDIARERSSWEALASLLYAPIGQADFKASLEAVGEDPAPYIFPRNVISIEGDSVGFEPGINQEGERAPSDYIADIEVANHTLALALKRLIEQNLLSESDFYMVLTLIPGVSIQDEAFLTDAIINLFEENHAEAVHLAVPRLESVTANVYQEMGKAVTKNQGTVYEQKGLGGLFGLVEEDVSLNFGKYLQYRYTKTSGHNIRNRMAHGQIRYGATDFKLASTVIFDIFRTAARISAFYSSEPED